MKLLNFINTHFTEDGTFLFYPWGKTGESYYITDEDRKKFNFLWNILALIILSLWLIAIVFNITVFFIPIHAIGGMLINIGLSIGIVYTYFSLKDLQPNLGISPTTNQASAQFIQALKLLVVGLFQFFVIRSDLQDFPESAFVKIVSIYVIIFYISLILILSITKGHLRLPPSSF